MNGDVIMRYIDTATGKFMYSDTYLTGRELYSLSESCWKSFGETFIEFVSETVPFHKRFLRHEEVTDTFKRLLVDKNKNARIFLSDALRVRVDGLDITVIVMSNNGIVKLYTFGHRHTCEVSIKDVEYIWEVIPYGGFNPCVCYIHNTWRYTPCKSVM